MTDRRARKAVAIVGGGFSGAAVAYHLAEARAPADILVFEPRATLGAGLAYGDDDPAHRINVPAARMSLAPDDEGQFARWLDASGALARDPAARVRADAYPARAEFGRYVGAALAPSMSRGAVRHVRAAVTRLLPENGGWRVETAGAAFAADLAAIATTHPPPGLPPELAALAGRPRLIADALAPGALRAVAPRNRVLIVGAGLTAADIVASLDAQGHLGEIVMIARRGLRSRGHANPPHPAEGDFTSAPVRRASELVARVRQAARLAAAQGRGWHPALEAARLQGQAIWAALEPDARRRLARHARPFWDAHRFRVAPQIESLLDAKLAQGSLRLRRARVCAARGDARGFDVNLGSGFERFDRIALATGPAHDDIFTHQPYLAGLRAAGFVAQDEFGWGLKTAPDGRAVGAADTLFVAGPLARGTFGELMGIPQVSVYARFLAERIADALA